MLRLPRLAPSMLAPSLLAPFMLATALLAPALLALASLTLVAGATSAEAAAPAAQSAPQFYRYWSYFHVVNGGYTYSKVGIGGYTPAQGTVEAFRYAASSENSPNLPRVDPSVATYAAICAGQAADAGHKLVGVIVDEGVAQDAKGQQLAPPTAACADVPTKATTLQVLQAVGQVRTKSVSFGVELCAIDGYPAQGCADATTDKATPPDGAFLPVALGGASASPTGTASPSPTPSGVPSPGSSANPGSATTQSTEQGRGDTPWPYVGVVVVVLGLLGGGVYLARRRRSA